MNYRIAFTVGLSVSFVCLVVTGVLMYSTEYDYFTSGLHLWSSVMVLLGVGGHLKNNWLPYKNHLKKKIGKGTFALLLIGIVPVSWGLIAEKAPFVSLVTFGENLRGASEVREGQFTAIDLSPDSTEQNRISLFIKAGNEYESEPQPLYWGLTYTAIPQIAVWLEDEQGQYVKTLYVTGKAANSGFYSAKEGEGRTKRPESLPYWSHKRGIKAEDGTFTPEMDSTEFDGRTAATPKGDHRITMSPALASGYRLMVEVNRSYDFNEHYHKNRFPNDPIYSGSGSSGQPSLIYQAVLNPEEKNSYMMQMVGHGHHSGQNGELYSDLSEITTAKDIVSFMVATIN